MSESPRAPKPAASPLDDVSLPTGGVILKSSDGVEFKAYKNILALASPFFRQMLALPQPGSHESGEDNGELSLIEMPETGATLDILLRMIYPIVLPQFPGTSEGGEIIDATELVNGIEPVIAAAIKYEMTPVVKDLCAMLLEGAEITRLDGSVINDTLALRVFVLACRNGLKAEARRAAHASLKGRVVGVFFEELRTITAAQYFHLIQFHAKVVAAVDLVVQSEERYGRPINEQNIGCTVCSDLRPKHFFDFPRWWKKFVIKARPILHESPKTLRVFHSEFLKDALVDADSCDDCKKHVHGKFHRASQIIKDKIDQAIAEVSYEVKR